MQNIEKTMGVGSDIYFFKWYKSEIFFHFKSVASWFSTTYSFKCFENICRTNSLTIIVIFKCVVFFQTWNPVQATLHWGILAQMTILMILFKKSKVHLRVKTRLMARIMIIVKSLSHQKRKKQVMEKNVLCIKNKKQENIMKLVQTKKT